MNDILIYAPSESPVLRRATEVLTQSGIRIADAPSRAVTHLLLGVPSFEADGRIRGGGILEHILADLSDDVTVIGGNLHRPMPERCRTIDLLVDGQYLAMNAAITADCAIRVAARELNVIWRGCNVLILGWGRIGKSLGMQLKNMGALVSIAARRSADRDQLRALGYTPAEAACLRHELAKFRVIFNTVPAQTLTEGQMDFCRRDCIKIELASQPGLPGSDVIRASGLPGKLAPDSSGYLIAQTVMRKLAEKEDAK